MTDTMLERMARAMFDAVVAMPGWNADDSRGLGSAEVDGTVDFYALARAALEAIRVPDPHLHETGREAGALMVEGRIMAVSPDAAFTAMIDAILSETPTNG